MKTPRLKRNVDSRNKRLTFCIAPASAGTLRSAAPWSEIYSICKTELSEIAQPGKMMWTQEIRLWFQDCETKV